MRLPIRGLTACAATTALAIGLALAVSPGTSAGSAAPAIRHDSRLHVMTFNLRFASNTPPNTWADRRPVMRELLRRERPQLIGTQEGLYAQLADIESDLGPAYDGIALGREGGSRGEFMMVFFDTRRLQPVEYDHFWLSDTPEVMGSKTWGGCCPRMVTWVRFLDKRTGKQFYAVNTHFEAFDADARSRSADLLLQRIGRFDPAIPVIAMGDFNEPAAAGRTVYDKLTVPLVDSWVTAESRSKLYATFHGYRPLVPDGPRIDWILTSPGVRTSKAVINTFERNGQFPSDHLPVQAVVTLP